MLTKYELYYEQWRVYRELNGLSDPRRVNWRYAEPGVYYIYSLNGVIAILIFVDDIVIRFYPYNEVGVRIRHITTDSNDSRSSSDNSNSRN